jgi:hypothetical protein
MGPTILLAATRSSVKCRVSGVHSTQVLSVECQVDVSAVVIHPNSEWAQLLLAATRSSVQCPVSIVQCPLSTVSCVECPVSSVSVECQVSSVECQVSSVKCQVSIPTCMHRVIIVNKLRCQQKLVSFVLNPN